MAWAIPRFNRGRIDNAGKDLLVLSGELTSWEQYESYNAALEVINNWRSSHGYPLQAIKMTLLNRSKRTDANAIVAQRLKRLSSIEAKLRRNKNMKLSQMQDLGGCRAILTKVSQVHEVIEAIEHAKASQPNRGPDAHKPYDYIASPKPDGYRSYHVVYKYRSTSSQHEIYNGLRVEVQVRTRRQHAWATAVETVDTFTNQGLKLGKGEARWRRFFALMGSAIAIREKCPVVPDTPSDPESLRMELQEIVRELNAINILEGLGAAVTIGDRAADDHTAAYLLELDSDARSIRVTGFRAQDLPRASQLYIEAEKRKDLQAVLVSVSSLAALRSAYPNYYLDTSAFLEMVRRAVSDVPRQISKPAR